MKELIESLWNDFQSESKTTKDSKSLDELRVKFLGKKGGVTNLLKQLSKVPMDERPSVGAQVNQLKERIQQILTERMNSLLTNENERKMQAEGIDPTLPGTAPNVGTLHPVSQVCDQIKSIFLSMGFFIADGPEVEEEYYNFEALNVPQHHPARDCQDTFYLENNQLLRTQTSPMQIRTMEKLKPPLKMIALGKVFRRDDDITHSPMFHQVEGLVVDENVSMSDLKGTLLLFSDMMFGKRPYRFRPHYFPFTEPSAELDIQCIFCQGKGCRVCKMSGWLEILGCGMVNPKVFDAVKYDSERYTGFAFGMGIDRIAMLRYGINHIKLLFDSDIRFLRQF
ncbi:phenylalanine--tRNA ligase subunit alpha [bacterium]|nr:phenylalanine--tRNA ligase subunit alpha [bacterium]